MGMNDLLFARELQLLRFLLGKAIYQWNGGCTLSTFPLFFWISRYLGKKWCLITELCISFSCKMALRWASCCWGVQTLPLRCTSCQDLCWQNTTKSASQWFLKVWRLFLCYMELQEWLHCLLQWKCLLRWRSFSFVRSQTVLVVHLAVGLYSGLATLCNRGSSVQI